MVAMKSKYLGFTPHQKDQYKNAVSKKRSLQKEGTGFTLIELLVVVAIITILSGIAAMSFSGTQEKARGAKARTDLESIFKAVQRLEVDTDQWPNHLAPKQTHNPEIWNLALCNAGLICNDGNFPNWDGPYMTDIPKDGWGNNYWFDPDYNGSACCGLGWIVAVGSFGKDGSQYTSDDIIKILYRPN